LNTHPVPGACSRSRYPILLSTDLTTFVDSDGGLPDHEWGLSGDGRKSYPSARDVYLATKFLDLLPSTR
jgi:hypothetical protein